jgi:hypothetical protein
VSPSSFVLSIISDEILAASERPFTCGVRQVRWKRRPILDPETIRDSQLRQKGHPVEYIDLYFDDTGLLSRLMPILARSGNRIVRLTRSFSNSDGETLILSCANPTVVAEKEQVERDCKWPHIRLAGPWQISSKRSNRDTAIERIFGISYEESPLFDSTINQKKSDT